MIKIDRDDQNIKELFEAKLELPRRRLAERYLSRRKQRSKQSTRLDVSKIREFKPDLIQIFNCKCAFCEQKMESFGEPDILWFRPRSDALNLNRRRSDPDHYWWLAYEWSNLYLSCRVCSRNKRNLFPVRGNRAPVGTIGEGLNVEKRLILDPCVDAPEQSLKFLSSGIVEPIDRVGEVTVRTFGLNRESLVKQRSKHAEKLLNCIGMIEKLDDDIPKPVLSKSEKGHYSQFLEFIDTSQQRGAEFCQLSRQLVARVNGDDVSEEKLGSTRRKHKISQSVKASVWMNSIEINNFRAIESLKIEFPEPLTEIGEEPWLMLLGENGLGKSTVLKAIALPYLVSQGNAEAILNPKSCVYDKAKSGRGFVRLNFSDETYAKVKFGKRQDGFLLEGGVPDNSILGYGATRLPPPEGDTQNTRAGRIRLANLFDPRASLTDIEPWLTDTRRVSKVKFDKLSSALLTLMALDDDAYIERRQGKLFIRIDGSRIPLRDMSDGYQSVIALATDIMINLASDWDNMANAEGIVLLDEIEVHLHPKWKMQIVSLLRQAFPRVRFVVTTHDPLCLHELRKSELHRLFRVVETNKVTSIQMDVPKGLRADQLLTGAWFGLSSTLDEDTRQLFQKYTDLLGSKQTEQVKMELSSVRAELNQRTGGVAETSVERIAVGVVTDAYKSSKKTKLGIQRK